MGDSMIRAHGGALTDLMLPAAAAAEAHATSRDWASWDLTPRQLCDLELILNAGFSPLTGFLGKADFDGVCKGMRLASGELWPIPITLDVTEEMADGLAAGDKVALRDPEGVMLAVLTVGEMWTIDRDAKALAVYGTTDRKHSGVAHLYERTNNVAVGGTVAGVQLPQHYDFVRLRNTPREVRARFEKLGWRKVVAFQTRNPMHRAHFELTLRAARRARGQPADPPGGGDDQARRRGSLHPRALLPAGAGPLPAQHGDVVAAAAGDAHGRAAGGAARTPSSARTTAAATSSSAATMPARATTPRASRSTAPTTPRRCCGSTRTRSASRWCPSRWSPMSRSSTPTGRSTRSRRGPGC